MQLPNNELVGGYVADTFDLLAGWRALEGLPPLTSAQVASIYDYKGVMALLDEQNQDEFTAEARMHINRVFLAYALSLTRKQSEASDFAIMGALTAVTAKHDGPGHSADVQTLLIDNECEINPDRWTAHDHARMDPLLTRRERAKGAA